MNTRNPLLVKGIEAAQAGNRTKARRLLTQAIRRNPDSVEAWLWLSDTLNTPEGRAFCLEKVLSIDPTNRPARRGLAALRAAQAPPAVTGIQPAPPPVAPQQPEMAAAAPPEGKGEAATLEPAIRPALASRVAGPWRRLTAWLGGGLSRLRDRLRVGPALAARVARLWNQPRFWRAVLICLGAIVLALAGVLAYDASRNRAGDELVAAGQPAKAPLAADGTATTPHPQHTLRPTFTFTPTPTDTPLPTDTPTPIPTPTFTYTPTPSPTPTPTLTLTLTLTPTPTRRSAGKPVATSTPRPTLVPLVWDPRLTALGVRLEPAAVPPGVGYWRLVEARWADEQESGGDHTIYVEVLSPRGIRVVGQPVIFEWSTGSLTLPVESRPAPDWGVNFPTFGTLGSYSARVGVELSDRVVGMGMGTVEAPDFTIHTNFYLIFRWTVR